MNIYSFCVCLGVLFSTGVVSAEVTVKSDPQAALDQGSRAENPVSAHYMDISDHALLSTISDPDQKIDPLFRTPEGLQEMVLFWLKIYTKYSFYHTVLFDRLNPNVIFDVVDTQKFFQKGSSPLVLELQREKAVKKAIERLRAGFLNLSQHPNHPFSPESVEGRLMATVGKLKPHQWNQLRSRIRAQSGQRDRIYQGLLNAERFFPAMEAILTRRDIPADISRLPLVESSFNLKAVSKADAVGVWQFLRRSAQEYLIVDKVHKIDERVSPIKSTYAAARLLKRNFQILKDWNLAVIAYNHGAKNLIPIRKKYHGNRIADLVRGAKKSPLGYASRNYLAEFYAILIAEKYKSFFYGLPSIEKHNAISMIRLKQPASIFELSSKYNISIHELKVFNPDIFDLKYRLPTGTKVVLPQEHPDSMVQTQPTNDPSSSPEDRMPAAEYIEFFK